MTPENCKKLLEMGILQAYAEGKKIEVLDPDDVWRVCSRPEWKSKPRYYRIKPEPTFEVGDLVRTQNNKVGSIQEFDCTGKLARLFITNKDRCWWPIVDLTKVREVRTPFTFKEAVKACAEHGIEVRHNGIEDTINGIDHNSIRVGTKYLYFSNSCLQTVFTSDNTPFCNISYEPITN